MIISYTGCALFHMEIHYFIDFTEKKMYDLIFSIEHTIFIVLFQVHSRVKLSAKLLGTPQKRKCSLYETRYKLL